MKMLLFGLMSCAAFAVSAHAQSYGSLNQKSSSISTTGPKSGFGAGLWANALGDSWNYPVRDYAYGKIVAGTGDSQTILTVSNRNLSSAVTTTDTLGNFLNNQAYSSYATNNIGYNASARNYGSYVKTLHFGNGTVVGFGVISSKWSNYSYKDAETGFTSTFQSNWGYQPGINPKVNAGRYSNTAWTRVNYLPVFSLNQTSLPMGKGYSRRWKIGEFTTAIDSARNNPYRYVFTTAQSLTASTRSGVYLIKKIYEQGFLGNASVPTAGMLTGSSETQEIVLQAGTTYDVVVQDGVNTGSCEGAQVAVYAQYYQ